MPDAGSQLRIGSFSLIPTRRRNDSVLYPPDSVACSNFFRGVNPYKETRIVFFFQTTLETNLAFSMMAPSPLGASVFATSVESTTNFVDVSRAGPDSVQNTYLHSDRFADKAALK
jgi:hypothetical protein